MSQIKELSIVYGLQSFRSFLMHGVQLFNDREVLIDWSASVLVLKKC